MARPETSFRIHHPGEFIKTEMEETPRLGIPELAALLDLPPVVLLDLLNGVGAINCCLADRLGEVFRKPPRYWLNLQSLYDTQQRLGMPRRIRGLTALPDRPFR